MALPLAVGYPQQPKKPPTNVVSWFWYIMYSCLVTLPTHVHKNYTSIATQSFHTIHPKYLQSLHPSLRLLPTHEPHAHVLTMHGCGQPLSSLLPSFLYIHITTHFLFTPPFIFHTVCITFSLSLHGKLNIFPSLIPTKLITIPIFFNLSPTPEPPLSAYPMSQCPPITLGTPPSFGP